METSVIVKKSNNRAMEEEEDLELVSSKKRKLYVELGNEYNNVVENPAVSSKCDDSESSNSNLMSPDLKDVHLESEDFETEIYNCLFRKSLPTTQTKPVMLPTEAELEEFFAAAEKSEQKRFAEKYNYDIVKDVPLEGKYEWVRLHP